MRHTVGMAECNNTTDMSELWEAYHSASYYSSPTYHHSLTGARHSVYGGYGEPSLGGHSAYVLADGPSTSAWTGSGVGNQATVSYN